MGISGVRGGRSVAFVPYLALALVLSGILWYAVRADGYQAHDARLNDGGVWVTNSTDGFYGRVNKPIGQLDGALFAKLDSTLDIVQDGAAVVGVDLSAGRVSTIDPASVQVPAGEEASIATGAAVQMQGGTIAVVDPVSGALWAQRTDPEAGLPVVSSLDRQAPPTAKAGRSAALAVTTGGTVLAVSAEDDTVTRIRADEYDYAEPEREDLGADAGDTVTLSAAGETPVALDPESGSLTVPGGGSADLAPGGVLQQPGPSDPRILVASSQDLRAVDLATGEDTPVVEGVSGRAAAPVRLGDCVYGAWSGGQGTVATRCGDDEPVVASLGAGTSDLVFRVNRGQILLNDRATGAVWNIDTQQPTRLDNWDSFKKKTVKSDKDEDNEKEDKGDRRPPKAKDDSFGARPGRTTVLHPLDNDTAPAGRILSVRSVQDVSGSDAEVTISPDGQTLQFRMPEQGRTTTFKYYVDDGRDDVSDSATVTVGPRSEDENADPTLREGFEPQSWTVPAGGVLDLPVLGDWRDKQDGDPLSLASAEAANGDTTGARARTTAGGRVRFTAPARGGQVTVSYFVTDGRGEPVKDELKIRVQERGDRQAYAGVAEPDVVSGETGKPITIRPLGNDLPGSDPVTPEAQLALAGKVAATGGAAVETDLAAGTITFRSAVAKTYFLDYDAAYGNAPLDQGRIRVDVRAPAKPPLSPIAVPDNVTLYGQASSLVDVLANDVDPTGGLLVVQSSAADSDNQLDVAVVDGRWVRVSARQGDLQPNPQLVHYTISNGDKSGVEGEIVVSQRPEPDDNTPVTEVDHATVRAGSSVAVPVLDNDFSPSGDALGLVRNVADEAAGELSVQRPGDERVPTGTAYVAGRLVRYVAPADLEDAGTFTVRYLATNDRGQTAPGRAEITVIPAARENQPPEPPALEGRVVSGDTLRLRLAGSGLDPDGDPVTLTGLGSAPELGRVLRLGANSIRYRAFPGSVGTDEFTYEVTDPSGAVATGTVRVGVVPPAPAQPPLAVADTVTAEPDRTVTVDVLANDQVAAGDRVTVDLLDPPAGVTLVSDTGPVQIRSPRSANGRTTEVGYRIDNGIDSSRSTLTLRTARPFNNPPVVFDAFGVDADAGEVATDGDTVTVDVLETAYDPDGPTSALRVVDVAAPPGVASSISGSEVTVARSAEPTVVPFRVEDADGGAATASVYVPARRPLAPYVPDDALIRVDSGKSVSAKLSDYVVNPGGGPLSFTLKDRIWASPASDLEASVTGDDSFDVRAAGRYAGPGAVSFEVTTGSSVDDPDATRAVVSVPVQVGDDVPILRCPSDPVPVPQGASIELDVTSLCHVWTPDPDSLDALGYTADWQESSPGLAIIEPEGSTITVAADGAAAPGSDGLLSVTTSGSAAGEIPLTVVKTPPPSLAPIRVSDLRAGESRTIDLARFLRPGVPDPDPTVLKVEQISGLDVQTSVEGSSVTLRAGAEVDGTALFRVEMSDVAGDPPANRRVEGRLSLEILDRPDTPLAPVPGRTVRSQEVHLEWRAPDANGAPIDYYEVRAPGAGAERCGSTSCDVTGLTNGKAYSFQVRAHNSVGWSPWSPGSAKAVPDAKPGIVGPISLTRVGDGTVTIRWSPPTTQTSKIRRYYVTWPGGPAGGKRVTGPTAVLGGLDNDHTYAFTVQAENDLDTGPSRTSAKFQSVGTPARPAAPAITDHPTPGDAGAVTLAWPGVDPNGPGPVRYTVIRNGRPLPSCTDIVATSCDNANITYDGTTYRYAVRATNKGVDVPGGAPRSATGPTSSYAAVGRPAAWGPWQLTPKGTNAQATASFTVPASRGARSTVRVYVDGALADQFEAKGPQTRTVGVPSNDRPYSVQLEVCNEADACTRSAAQSVQTYGPLNSSHVLSIRPNASGTKVSWSFSVDTNGNAATVRITSNQGRNQTFQANGVDVQSFTSSTKDLGYSTTEKVTVTISDTSPDRGSGSRTASYTTRNPPPPEVSVSQGSHCNDKGSNPCYHGGAGTPCYVESCAHVSIRTENFTSSRATCRIFESNGGQFSTKTVDTNRTTEPGTYFGYPGHKVWAVCDGVESNHYDWPNS